MASSLARMYSERAGDPMIKARDGAYAMLESYSKGRPKGGDPQGAAAYAFPFLFDINRAVDGKLRVNQTRQIINHFTAMFAEMPKTWSLPASGDESDQVQAGKNTQLINHIYRRSNMAMRQPQQSRWLSVRGDAVYAVEWDESEDVQQRIHVRSWDPSMCYPTMNELDIGAVHDMLLHWKWGRSQIKETFGFNPPGRNTLCDVYVYWDSTSKIMQVDDIPIDRHSFDHNLGFVPFRWCFADGAGQMGMSDVGDMLPLQDAYNEITELMMDSLRRTIDPAWWGKGLKGNVTPRPGEVVSVPPDADIHRFETSDPPAVAMQVLDHVLGDIGRVSGVSPISMEGHASGSIVTGKAVRNQVEAIEARAKTRRISVEATFARLSEMILRTVEQKFADTELRYRGPDDTNQSVKGSDIKGWWECGAAYGQLSGMDLPQRLQTVLQGVNRLYPLRTAISLADVDDEQDPSAVIKQIEADQINQSVLMARAQMAAQQVQSEGGGQQGPSSPPGVQPPQGPQQHPAPTAGGFMQVIGHVERALALLQHQLTGAVWIVGEMALTGKSAAPELLVDKSHDLPYVRSMMEALHGTADLGRPPKGDPQLKVA